MTVGVPWKTKFCLVCPVRLRLLWPIRVFAILTKFAEPTRLETRTKESNICASIWVPNLNA